MKEADVDIVEIMIKSIGEESEWQRRVKLYMEVHKSNCNEYIYEKYEREAVTVNAIIKMLTSDIGAEIVRVIKEKEEKK